METSSKGSMVNPSKHGMSLPKMIQKIPGVLLQLEVDRNGDSLLNGVVTEDTRI